ncbi:MAG TPA: hypothetical protein VFE58_09375 [Tepidisphaeraceae bacterium]|nr:hypothetical protein [Tepidisphaeraceae bacterium]
MTASNDDLTSSANLPTLPEIAQKITPSHSFPADPTNDHASSDAPIPCTATPIQPPPTANLLTTRQLNAIPLILAGQSDSDVAESVGVRRESVNRWRNQHPRFIAELNRQRHLLHSATADRYHALLLQAMDVLERYQSSQLDYVQNQAKAAISLLRSAPRRLFAAPPSTCAQPATPDQILQDLLSQGLPPSPDDSPADDAPPPPPPPPNSPKKSRRQSSSDPEP